MSDSELVVSMKNVSSKNATSTMGVMSILTPIRRIFFAAIYFVASFIDRTSTTSTLASSIM